MGSAGFAQELLMARKIIRKLYLEKINELIRVFFWIWEGFSLRVLVVKLFSTRTI